MVYFMLKDYPKMVLILPFTISFSYWLISLNSFFCHLDITSLHFIQGLLKPLKTILHNVI